MGFYTDLIMEFGIYRGSLFLRILIAPKMELMLSMQDS